MCLQHHRIWKWVHGLTEHKSTSLHAIIYMYVSTEPWNLVDTYTIVVYGTVEFVPITAKLVGNFKLSTAP